MPNGLLRIQLIRFPPRIALLAVLAAAGTVDAVEAAQAAQTGVPLDQALAQGNPSLVAAALQAMPHDATTAAMVRSQLSYDLPTVMASALRCQFSGRGRVVWQGRLPCSPRAGGCKGNLRGNSMDEEQGLPGCWAAAVVGKRL